LLPRGLAIRAGAAPGINPFGTTAEAWGAATEPGQDTAGNARLILDPGKYGLELSQRCQSLWREPRSKRRKAGAPRKQMSAHIAYTCLRGAQPRPRHQHAATFVDVARQWLALRLSALRLPLLPGGESIFLRWRRSCAQSSGAEALRERRRLRHCERQRSNPVGLHGKLDCFVAIAPRNDDRAYPPPRSETERARGTTRRVVEGARGVDASDEADAPPPPCGRSPLPAARDASTTRRPRRLRPTNPRAPGGRPRGAYSAERLRSETGAGVRAPGRRRISGCLANARGSW
jgi:hypothetical protein